MLLSKDYVIDKAPVGFELLGWLRDSSFSCVDTELRFLENIENLADFCVLFFVFCFFLRCIPFPTLVIIFLQVADQILL